MADQVRFRRAEKGQRPGAQPVALPGGDRRAGQRPTDVHGLDLEVQRLIPIGAAGEDRVHRLQHLVRVDGARGHDGLSQDLPAEHDVARPFGEVLGHEPSRAGLLEVEHLQEP